MDEPAEQASGVAGVDEFDVEAEAQNSDAEQATVVEFEELPGVATVAGGGEVWVSWPASQPVAGSPVAGYEVQWARVGEDFGLSARAVVIGLSYTIWGLDDSVNYRVRVRDAQVQRAVAAGASITAGAGSDPVAAVVGDAPGLEGSQRRSVSAFEGAVRFEMAGDEVWPATISLPVDMDAVADGDVQLAYFNEALGVWVPAPESVLDTERGVISAEVYHLSLWRAICSVGLSGLCSKIVDVIDRGVQAIEGIVASSWDAGTGWLRDGWQDAREYTLGDVPALAAAVLKKLRETGAEVAPWALAGLELAAGMSAVDLRDIATMVVEGFGYGVAKPACDAQRPDWANATAEFASDAVLLCAESAAGVSGESDLMMANTVNRGYSMILRSETRGVDFGEPAPNHVSVQDAQMPVSLADLAASALLPWGSKELFLPAGSTTRLRIPRSALGERLQAKFSYEVNLLATVLQALLFAINILCRGKCSAAQHAPQILQCAWSNISHAVNEDFAMPQSVTLETVEELIRAARDYKRRILSDCVTPHMPPIMQSNRLERLLLVLEGAVLLHEFGRMVLDSTFSPRSHQLTITATSSASTAPTKQLDCPTGQHRHGTCEDDHPPKPPCAQHEQTYTYHDEQGDNAESTVPPCPTQPDENTTPDSPSTDTATGIYTEISVGGVHSCAIKTDGTVTCWGRNYAGQAVAPSGRFKAVSAGNSHSCAIRADDTVTCWGDNGIGEAVAPSGRFEAVSAGAGHSCAIKTDDTITCWGSNDHGQADAPAGKFKAVTAGGGLSASYVGYSCAIRADDTVTCWGANYDGQADAPSGKFKAVSAGAWHSCAIRADDTVTCWGANYFGQADAPSGRFKAVSAGGGYSCAIKTDGTVTCWGENVVGQAVAPSGRFEAVSAGNGHSCAIRADGTVTCWGANYAGQAVAPSGKFKAVSAGEYHSCAIRADDTVTCWGDNYFGQADAPSGRFKAVSAGNSHSCAIRADDTVTCWGRNQAPAGKYAGRFKAVSAGSGHSCAIRADDTVTCWGDNVVGQAVAPSGRFEAVSAGTEHSCAIRADDMVTCWGANYFGQADAPSGRFKAVSAGNSHSCAIRADDTVTCWGDNVVGQADAPSGRFKAVSAGNSHSCAIRADDTVICWGANNFGQADAPSGRFKAVSAVTEYSCAIRADDTVICWGSIVR